MKHDYPAVTPVVDFASLIVSGSKEYDVEASSLNSVTLHEKPPSSASGSRSNSAPKLYQLQHSF
jgi:hypothetical protein